MKRYSYNSFANRFIIFTCTNLSGYDTFKLFFPRSCHSVFIKLIYFWNIECTVAATYVSMWYVRISERAKRYSIQKAVLKMSLQFLIGRSIIFALINTCQTLQKENDKSTFWEQMQIEIQLSFNYSSIGSYSCTEKFY